jgi:hypothetical protein
MEVSDMSIFHQFLLFSDSSRYPVAFNFHTLLVKLHLLPLILYLLMTRFFFPGWAAAHEVLCIGLLASIVAGTLAMWLAPLIRRLREEHRAKAVLLSEIQFARGTGLSTEDLHFTVKNGFPFLNTMNNGKAGHGPPFTCIPPNERAPDGKNQMLFVFKSFRAGKILPFQCYRMNGYDTGPLLLAQSSIYFVPSLPPSWTASTNEDA